MAMVACEAIGVWLLLVFSSENLDGDRLLLILFAPPEVDALLLTTILTRFGWSEVVCRFEGGEILGLAVVGG